MGVIDGIGGGDMGVIDGIGGDSGYAQILPLGIGYAAEMCCTAANWRSIYSMDIGLDKVRTG